MGGSKVPASKALYLMVFDKHDDDGGGGGGGDGDGGNVMMMITNK